jgi:parvulin-like peptidyl-prolyl isomerase
MHVLIDTKCRTPEAAKTRALEARQELLDGKPFVDVVKKYSDDPTAGRNNGDIGPMVVDSLTPAFAEAVQTMKPGDLSEPVLTNFGYHIIKLQSIKKGRAIPYAEVRTSIIADLKEDWLKQQRKANIEKITADPGLNLDLEAIQALKTDPNVPAPRPTRPE